ncbi:type III PLP-dependent enzyme [Microbacterium sp. P03]|uniref:type III PLP-dependent enzyme n=1 Tax=Microbacterium sp. P03 TaxID=3366946 RepID=UPI003746310C
MTITIAPEVLRSSARTPIDPLTDGRESCSRLLSTDAARAALAREGTPLMLLDLAPVRRCYRRLRAALPRVRFHYAVKALSHDAVIAALGDEGCSFDIATAQELHQVLRAGISHTRVIHTHPIKKPSEIAEALRRGVRMFVVDNESEIDKFTGAPPDTRLLIRLAYRSPSAKSDLSGKFGVSGAEASELLGHAQRRGIRIAGFSYHVGSQLDDPGRFARALTDTLDLMERLEKTAAARFDTLDIGGGFPVAYDEQVRPLEDFAGVLAPILDERARHLDVIAEPGRILVADAMSLVTSVVGIADRDDGRWYYIDDGVYGSYSNIVAEDVHPLVFGVDEVLQDEEPVAQAGNTRRRVTLGGPTCDSADVIARVVPLPDLRVGDLLVSPAMGAYTSVTATTFNGRPVTPIVVIGGQTVP